MNYQWTETRAATPIVELCRHTLHAGRRDELITLFEEQFVEPQEAAGARVLGTFRVDGDDRSFVWLRGFADMRARRAALAEFYGGEVWRTHRDAVNATMIGGADIHLLRTIAPADGVPVDGLSRPAFGGNWRAQPCRLLISELRYPEAVGNYHLWLRLLLRKAGVVPVASLATLAAENNFPALPVWTNRPAHVALLRDGGALPQLPPDLGAVLKAPPRLLPLVPTSRSLLR